MERRAVAGWPRRRGARVNMRDHAAESRVLTQVGGGGRGLARSVYAHTNGEVGEENATQLRAQGDCEKRV